jgi:predicted peroxiredoxin
VSGKLRFVFCTKILRVFLKFNFEKLELQNFEKTNCIRRVCVRAGVLLSDCMGSLELLVLVLVHLMVLYITVHVVQYKVTGRLC